MISPIGQVHISFSDDDDEFPGHRAIRSHHRQPPEAPQCRPERKAYCRRRENLSSAYSVFPSASDSALRKRSRTNWERRESHEQRGIGLFWHAVDLQIRTAAQDGFEHSLRVLDRQICAQADMRSGSEREMALGGDLRPSTHVKITELLGVKAF